MRARTCMYPRNAASSTTPATIDPITTQSATVSAGVCGGIPVCCGGVLTRRFSTARHGPLGCHVGLLRAKLCASDHVISKFLSIGTASAPVPANTLGECDCSPDGPLG